ncbi:DUF934 domain-containing protein [Psychrobacter sp. I-STPA10]|uniref:DUF934 domain-containing protein n=1 Tax=Psychrobacter sp. I-STPA10 TaxID=2585769 RepID=UPI001E5494CE|nr:DUF934 domain-containing protein [Psychrobacter sp. I-STPA10]
MANHHILDNQAYDITSNDTWQAIAVAQLPDGIASNEIELSELLHKQEKLDIILPLTDVLAAPEGLLHQTLELVTARCSRLGLWADTDISTEQLDALLALQKDKDNTLLHALDLLVFYMPAFADGRSFSQIKHLRLQGYTGEIRVAGAYGRDQIAYLLRAGVDSFILPSSEVTEDIQAAFVALPSAYNGDNASRLPMFR